MSNLVPIATFFIRLTGVTFLTDATINLTYLPEYLAALGNAKPGASANLHEFEAFMILVRVFLLLLFGFVFLIFSKSLAKLFTRGLRQEADQPSQADIWPPAPKV